MSICAFSIGSQECKAVIKWLHCRYVLKAGKKDYFVTEFIVKVEDKKMEYLDLYTHFETKIIENRTQNLLDSNNKQHYPEGYIVHQCNKNNKKEIEIAGCKAEVNDVDFVASPTDRGTVTRIIFSKKIGSGESRAVRFLSECNNLSKRDGDRFVVSRAE